MAISASDVKKLREMTGAGMMDSKKALEATNGDFDKAIEFLREKGLAGAQKKAGRIAAEGICDTLVSSDNKKGVVVEVNSETDFVAKNEKFRNFVADVCSQALDSNASDDNIDEFLNEKWKKDSSKTVSEALAGEIAVIGENMHIRRKKTLVAKEGFVLSYIHSQGRIAVLVDVKTDKVSNEAKDMAKNIAMQIAALNPVYVRSEDVSEDYKNKEREILLAQAKEEAPDKPENILKGMVEGRLNKELKEICLLNQVYVKADDGKQTVAQYVESVAKATGSNLSINSFVRFETGEGLEKKNEDFAAEVAAQMK